MQRCRNELCTRRPANRPLGPLLVVDGRVDVGFAATSRTARGTRARPRGRRAGSRGSARPAATRRGCWTDSPREQSNRGHGALRGPRRIASPTVHAPETPVPPLALVTVTHESERELAALLDSVARHLPSAQVVVVDCASTDSSLQVARDRKLVTTIELDENIGFGRASQRRSEGGPGAGHGARQPRRRADRRLAADARGRGTARRPERLLAPLVLSPDGSRQDTVHPLPGLRGGPRPRGHLADVVAGPALAPWKSSTPRRVGWAVGCALAARTETLRQLGPFDESIFLYGEDLELGLRAAEQGIETWFWPDARVIHHRAHSSKRAFGGEPFELVARARHDVVQRRLGTARARLDDASQAVTFASRVRRQARAGAAGRARAQAARGGPATAASDEPAATARWRSVPARRP